MKKVFSILFAALTLTTSINLVAKEQNDINSTRYLTGKLEIKNFNGIAAAGPINVVVTLGNKEGCRFEGDAEAIASLIAEVKNEILIIRPENSLTSWSRKYENKKITAYVTAKTLKSLTMSGSGEMIVNGKINSNDFAATLSGSGSIKATADSKDFNGVISGSGSITITGSANQAKIVISSSGTFSGKSFAVDNLATTISGSGTVNIKVDRAIKAMISGSGTVNYYGNPTIEKTVIGSGGVRKI